MQIKISQEEGGQVLKIEGTLDIEAAQELQWALRDSIEANPGLILDLGGVDACDAAALQVLYSARKTAVLSHKPLRVLELSEAVEDAAAALGLAIGELAAGHQSNEPSEGRASAL